jgi:hypothetical protein
VLASQWVDLLGYAAAGAVFATYSMKTMIPLRIIGIASNFLFILYGIAAHAPPVLVLHIILLPLNVWRLRQMIVLIEKVRVAASGDLSTGWLRPFMTAFECNAGETIFHVGDPADRMFYIVSGKYSLVELELELGSGALVGEIGLVSPGNRRTVSFRCDVPGELLTMHYDKVRELYFQNPEFGFYLLQLIGGRLVRNMVELTGGRESPFSSNYGDLEPEEEDSRFGKPKARVELAEN